MVVSSRNAIGPRACNFCVLIPISAPNPNSPPSVNRVDALTSTAAESTAAVKCRAAAWSWFTGWFNFLGQVAVTAGVDYGAAFFTNAFLALQFGFEATPVHTVEIFAVILLLHGLLNTLGVKLVARLNDISVWWHLIGVTVIVGALAVLPSEHASASFVFTEFVNNTGFTSNFYVAMLGLLLARITR